MQDQSTAHPPHGADIAYQTVASYRTGVGMVVRGLGAVSAGEAV